MHNGVTLAIQDCVRISKNGGKLKNLNMVNIIRDKKGLYKKF